MVIVLHRFHSSTNGDGLSSFSFKFIPNLDTQWTIKLVFVLLNFSSSHIYFKLYTAHPDGVIGKKLTIDDKYINKPVWRFIHQDVFLIGVDKKKLLWL